MLRMGGSGGRRRAELSPSTSSPALPLGITFGGAALCAGAWFLLVKAAIDFGGSARNGRTAGWLFMALATVGAIACLVLVLVLITRGLTTLGVIRPDRTAVSSGGGRRVLHK